MFLLDPVARTTQPQTNPMEDSRTGNLGIVAGIESAQPTNPVTDATVTVVAYVTMSPSGITNIAQNGATQLPNLTVVNGEVQGLVQFEAQINAQIAIRN